MTTLGKHQEDVVNELAWSDNSTDASDSSARNNAYISCDDQIVELIAVVEELIGTLISKRALLITDLPPNVQKFARGSHIFGHELQKLLPTSDSISLSETLCVRHDMSSKRSMYAKQDAQEEG